MADKAQSAPTALQTAVGNINKERHERAAARIEAELRVLGSINDEISALTKEAQKVRDGIEKIAAEVPATVEELLGKK